MMRAGIVQPICAILVGLLAAPLGFAQNPAPAVPAAPAPPVNTTPLGIFVLEGNNAVNSTSLVRTVSPVVEIRDSNDFPVEGATVIFTLPSEGPGGAFAKGGKTYSTRSDARGQAASAPIIPVGEGKFQIVVTASLGDRKGQTAIIQTNASGSYSGPPSPSRPFYKRKLFWAVVGGAAIAAVVVVVLNKGGSKSSNSTVVVTPGPPVFH